MIRGPYIKGEDAAKPVVELGEVEDAVSGLMSTSRCRDAVVSAVCGGADTVKEVCQCFFRVSTESTGGGVKALELPRYSSPTFKARRGKTNNLESFTFEWIFQTTPEAGL